MDGRDNLRMGCGISVDKLNGRCKHQQEHVKTQWGGQNRLEGSRAESPLLVMRIPEKFRRLLKRAAKARGITPSALAREILEKALEREGRRS